MAIRNIIAQGIGFTPGSIKFIPTLGFNISTFVAGTPVSGPLLAELANTGIAWADVSSDGQTSVVNSNEGDTKLEL